MAKTTKTSRAKTAKTAKSAKPAAKKKLAVKDLSPKESQVKGGRTLTIKRVN